MNEAKPFWRPNEEKPNLTELAFCDAINLRTRAETAERELDEWKRRALIAELALDTCRELTEALRADNARLRGEANGRRRMDDSGEQQAGVVESVGIDDASASKPGGKARGHRNP